LSRAGGAPMMRRLTWTALAAAAAACSPGGGKASPSDSAGVAKATGAPAQVSGTRIGAPRSTAAGEWQMPAGDYASSRFSDLDQITPANAANLKAAWTFSTGVLRGHEGQPLVVNNTMYLVTPYPNVSYALDLATPGQPLKWKFRPENAQAAAGQACCDVVNRGAAYADGKIFYNLLDGHTVGVDAATGKQLWRTRMADLDRGETMTMAPIVVKGKVLVGSSGGEMGVRGWLAAIDANTGKEVWRGYNTGSDRDIKVGPRFKAFYPQDNGKDLGLTSWPGETWKQGGAAVWGWLSYDPELNLVYYGTSNPGPWNEGVRKGDNKWSCAIMARDADTGELVWAFQVTPHDMWDYDTVNENILVDLPLGGTTRKALVHFDRNGYGYTLDRATGEVLVAQPFVQMNWSTGVDLKTGRPNVVPAKMTKEGTLVKDICPSLEGGKNQQPAAFSPRTGLFYVPTNNLCMDFESRPVTYIPGTPYIGANAPEKKGPGGHGGEFIAWDATTGKKVWGIEEPFPVWGGALATAGGVVFYGTLDGWFKAVDATSGKELWKFKVGSGVVGNPIAYLGPDGKQYIAVYSGIGGDMGLLIAGDVAANLPYDVRERGSTLPDLARWTAWGGMLFVFSL
ncbi:MAG TPA: PQQ-dependent dehydrogenase, methanol/ethanol family, partial [Gemmatimonadaceae bacterium]|nr:PQQ-dependent dehydrogenase, methanol/ethanol family [Gemmatimonadaceae bacterium]